MTRTRLAAGLLLIASAFFVSCSKDNDKPNNVVTYTATITGSAETPPNTSTATGEGNFTYNIDTRILSGTVSFTDITPVAMHIHLGAPGTPGDVVFPIGAPPYTSPVSFTSPALSDAQQTDLMNNMYYINIHSATYPDGEIRGQLIKK